MCFFVVPECLATCEANGPKIKQAKWRRLTATNDAPNFESSKFVFVTDSHAMSAFAKMFSDFTETLRI